MSLLSTLYLLNKLDLDLVSVRTIQTMRSPIEKCNENKISLLLIFIDFEKAFDSVEI